MTTFRRELIPAGSHLSLAVYSATRSTEVVFATMVELIRRSTDSNARYVEFAPRSVVDDESVDVRQVLAEVDFGKEGIPQPLTQEPGRLPVRAYVTTKRFGPIVIERVTAFDRTLRERQVVEAHLANDELGIPPRLWSSKDRRRALARHDWASALFAEVCVRADALYGHLVNEATLPNPAQIIDGYRVEGAVFLSRSIVGTPSGFLDDLKDRYGSNVVTEISNGVVLDGLVEFGKTGVTYENSAKFTAEITRFLAKGLRPSA